jgi:signal transduction histidine kinase
MENWEKDLGKDNYKEIFEKKLGEKIKWGVLEEQNGKKKIINDCFYIEKIENKGIYKDNYKNNILVIKNGERSLFIKVKDFLGKNSRDSLEFNIQKRFFAYFSISNYKESKSIRIKHLDIGKNRYYINYKGIISPINPILFILLIFLFIFFYSSENRYFRIFVAIFSLILTILLHFDISFFYILLSFLYITEKEKQMIFVCHMAAITLIFFSGIPLYYIYLSIILLNEIRQPTKYNLYFISGFILILSIKIPITLILIFLIIILQKRSIKWKVIIIYTFVVLLSIINLKFYTDDTIIQKKVEKILKNDDVKYSLLHKDMSFISFILKKYYFKENDIKISFFDENKRLIDRFVSPIFSTINIPKNSKNKKRSIQINGINYKYYHFYNKINIKNIDIGSFEIEILTEKGFSILIFFKLFTFIGYIATIILFLSLIIFGNFIKNNYKKIYNNLNLRILLLFFLSGVVLFIVLSNLYYLSEEHKDRIKLQKESTLFIAKLKREARIIENEFAANYSFLSGKYNLDKADILIFRNKNGIREYHFIERKGKIYLGRQVTDKYLFLVLFRDILFRMNRLEIIPITIYRAGEIVFNSNISGIIEGEIPTFLNYGDQGIIRTKKNLYFFHSKKSEDKNDYSLLILKTKKGNPIGFFFFAGLYFIFMIFIILSIDIITRERKKQIGILQNGFIQLRSGNFKFRIKKRESNNFSQIFEDFNFMTIRLEELIKKETEHEALKNLEKITKKVAHEIKNPLTPIKMLIDHLLILYKEDKKEFNKIFIESFEIIYEQINYLRNLSEDFFYMSKLSAIKKRTIKITKFIEEIKIIFKGMAEKHNITINIDIVPYEIQADKNLLRHLFINLIENSIDILKNKEGGEIIIEGKKQGKNYRFRYRDTGGGINEKLISKIFLSDFSTKKAGMGLGLAFVKQVVEMHYGSIKAKNGKRGLIIDIYLPAS